MVSVTGLVRGKMENYEGKEVSIVVLGLAVILCYIVLMMTIGFWATAAFFGLGLVKREADKLGIN